jgi:hypothetical protein
MTFQQTIFTRYPSQLVKRCEVARPDHARECGEIVAGTRGRNEVDCLSELGFAKKELRLAMGGGLTSWRDLGGLGVSVVRRLVADEEDHSVMGLGSGLANLMVTR